MKTLSDELLQVQNLQLSFDDSPGSLLHKVSFSVNRGEILGICGESGCGKTLTALSLIGLLPESAEADGQILFKGQDLLSLTENGWRSIRGREISMIFQDAQQALNPVQRIGKQVAETLRIHHPELSSRERKQKVLDMLSRVELPSAERAARSFPHELSGGMRQRVCLAIALMNHPSLLLADEPTTALDPSVREKVLALMERFRREDDLAILFISHDIRTVRRFCDRVLIYYAGEILESGPVDEVLSSPAHPYTRLLIQAMPALSPSGKKLVEIPGRVPSSAAIAAHHAEEHPPCIFYERCPWRLPLCQKEEVKRHCRGEHAVLCHRADLWLDGTKEGGNL